MIVHRRNHEVCDQNRIKTRKIVPPSSRTIALLTITTMKIESFIIFSLALGNIRNIQVNISVKWIKIISLSTLAFFPLIILKNFTFGGFCQVSILSFMRPRISFLLHVEGNAVKVLNPLIYRKYVGTCRIQVE